MKKRLEQKGFNQYPKHFHSFILKQKLTFKEKSLLIFISEKIYDFQKFRSVCSRPLSLNYMSEGIGSQKRNLIKSLTSLEEKNFIVIKPSDQNLPRIISIAPLIKKHLSYLKEKYPDDFEGWRGHFNG